MNLKVLISVIAAAVVIAGGALALTLAGFFSPAEDDALELVPADAVIYVNAFLDPSPAQKLALDDLLAHFPEASDREAARAAIVELIDKGLAEAGLTFEADVEPWLGDQVAFFFVAPPNVTAEPPVGVLIETEDINAALDAVDKAQANDDATFTTRTYKGVAYDVSDNGDAVGAVESFLVTASEAGIKSVIDASQGESLATSERFERVTGNLEEDRLALGYFDLAPLARLGGASIPGGLGGPFDPTNQSPAAFVLYARGDAVVAEGSSEIPQEGPGAGLVQSAGKESKMLERLPGNAWLAFGAPDLGGSLRALVRSLEDALAQAPGGIFPGLDPGTLIEGFEMQIGLSLEADLFSWMGDAAFFASGSDPASIQGGAVFEATDPAGARRAITRIRGAIERLGGPVRDLDALGDFDGFALREKGMPEPFNVVVADERVLAIYGGNATGEALGSDPSLAGNETFRDARAALGEDYALNGFLDLEEMVDLVNRFGLGSSPYAEEADKWLEPLSFMSFGARVEGDSVTQRVVIGVR